MNQLGRRNSTTNSPPLRSLPGQNLLLRALSVEDLDRLTPHLEHLMLPVQFVLHDESNFDFAYFLNSGVGSLVNRFTDGGSVETGITGREGFWGSPLLAGLQSSPSRSFMQIAGEGFRVRQEVFVEHVRRSRSFEDLLHRACYLELMQSRQLAACNAHHEVVERLARWLLMCDDRVRNDVVALTHEFLALMLGTRRSSVTLAASALQGAGLIRYTRGDIHIVNRADLEDAACQCYGIMADEYERVIGLTRHRNGHQPDDAAVGDVPVEPGRDGSH